MQSSNSPSLWRPHPVCAYTEISAKNSNDVLQPSTPCSLRKMLHSPSAPSPSVTTLNATAPQIPARHPKGLQIKLSLLSPCGASKKSRYFVDHRRVRLIAGSGGDGASTFHSEPRKEWGGPDGGNGGAGGDIIIKVDQQVKSLSSLAALYYGKKGEGGSSKNCYGRNGSPTYISVPIGTIVKEEGGIVVDLSQHGLLYTAAYGGAGGKGNRFFLSNENRAPMTATPGEKGQERVIQLEMLTVAHAGLVGFPNAGKSSLLRAISNARPVVAAYPFTTLNPHVGIVKYKDHEQVAVADIPGLIPGAHLNRGLGISFLRHIERCRILLYVLDMSLRNPCEQLQQLSFELEQYKPHLSRRPHAIVANKMDLPNTSENLKALRSHVHQRVIPISALTGDNTEELIIHLRQLYDSYPQSSSNSRLLPRKT